MINKNSKNWVGWESNPLMKIKQLVLRIKIIVTRNYYVDIFKGIINKTL